MDEIEQAAIHALERHTSGIIEATKDDTWSARTSAVRTGLAEANATWWRRHALDRSAYKRDLARLNKLAGWREHYAQLGTWKPASGAALLMPPKFFAGDPSLLEPSFVASMSLNHAVLGEYSDAFGAELEEQQSEAGALVSHMSYFNTNDIYRPFFKPRGAVLRAYAKAIRARNVPAAKEIGELNRRWAFYVEAFPTRSRKFKPPPNQPTSVSLASKVFVCAINDIVHCLVLKLLRPKVVMLAGQASWGRWPDSGFVGLGRDVSSRVRSSGRKCSVFRTCAESSVYESRVNVVRTNFLRTPYGPNSSIELERLGATVLPNRGADR